MSQSLQCLLLALSFGFTILAAPHESVAGPLIGPGQDDFDREVGNVSDDAQQLSYEFFRPPGYAAADKLPLVIYLHGYSDGQPFQQARLNETMNGLVNATQTSGAQAAYLLVPKIPIVEGWNLYRDLVRSLIDDVASRYEIDGRRRYLTGFSDGGFQMLPMIVENPDFFAAGAPISGGGFPAPATIDSLKTVPLWFFHGSSDPTVHPSNSSNMVNALVAAGGNAKLTLMRGGHNAAYAFAYADANHQFYPWLFGQSLPVPEPSSFALMGIALGRLTTLRRRKQ